MDLVDRIKARVFVNAETGCWVWPDGLSRTGYGMVWNGRGMTTVHRVMLANKLGHELPGRPWETDHLCRNRACCNPDHLELVTHRENLYRRAHSATNVHCANGHRWDDNNVRVDKLGVRHCRTCKNESRKRSEEKSLDKQIDSMRGWLP